VLASSIRSIGCWTVPKSHLLRRCANVPCAKDGPTTTSVSTPVTAPGALLEEAVRQIVSSQSSEASSTIDLQKMIETHVREAVPLLITAEIEARADDTLHQVVEEKVERALASKTKSAEAGADDALHQVVEEKVEQALASKSKSAEGPDVYKVVNESTEKLQLAVSSKIEASEACQMMDQKVQEAVSLLRSDLGQDNPKALESKMAELMELLRDELASHMSSQSLHSMIEDKVNCAMNNLRTDLKEQIQEMVEHSVKDILQSFKKDMHTQICINKETQEEVVKLQVQQALIPLREEISQIQASQDVQQIVEVKVQEAIASSRKDDDATNVDRQPSQAEKSDATFSEAVEQAPTPRLTIMQRVTYAVKFLIGGLAAVVAGSCAFEVLAAPARSKRTASTK